MDFVVLFFCTARMAGCICSSRVTPRIFAEVTPTPASAPLGGAWQGVTPDTFLLGVTKVSGVTSIGKREREWLCTNEVSDTLNFRALENG